MVRSTIANSATMMTPRTPYGAYGMGSPYGMSPYGMTSPYGMGYGMGSPYGGYGMGSPYGGYGMMGAPIGGMLGAPMGGMMGSPMGGSSAMNGLLYQGLRMLKF